MSANVFTDETSATQVGAAGSAGSFEFGASTPSSTAGVVTVDGTALNSGAHIAAGLVAPSSNNHTTGSVTIGTGGGTTTVSTGKSSYPMFTVANSSSNIFVSGLTAATVTIQNCGASSLSAPYSFV